MNKKKLTGKSIVNFFEFILLVCLSLIFILPVATVVMNSFKSKLSIREGKGQAFNLLTKDSFVGFSNYKNGGEKVQILDAIKLSLILTIVSVAIIILLTSMTAWYIARVKSKVASIVYYAFVFSMVVPFQMVMFPMSSVADMLGLGNSYGLVLMYVGFGAGLCVFMFTGFVKAIPYDIEEAAMIDGCNPIQTYFRVVAPMLKPTMITVAILETMWVWNDYLLPKLILPSEKKTIPIAVDACTGTHGVKELGYLMAMLVVAVIPIIIFYLVCQKHIIKGVAAGAVKG